MKHLITIIFFLSLLAACAPKFNIKPNTPIEKLRISLVIHERFSATDSAKLTIALEHTIAQWNLENHSFKLTSTPTDTPDLVIHIDSVFVPGKFLQTTTLIFNSATWLTGFYGVLELRKPLYVILPFVKFQPSNFTHIKYQLNNLTETQKEISTRFIDKTRLLHNLDQERNRQLREFSTQLFDFLELIEKEYNKKNGVKS